MSSVLPSQTRDKRISSSSTLPPVEQSGESLLMPSLANLKSTSKTKPLPKIKQSMNQHEDELAEEKYQMEKEKYLADKLKKSSQQQQKVVHKKTSSKNRYELESSFDEENDDSKNKSKNESDNDEQEDPKDYCKGGYHHVNIGDVYNDRYKVLRKVGWGHFSTVWLSLDTKKYRYVALKVVKSAKHYTETALDEIKLLRAVRETDPDDPNRLKTVQLYDDFKIHGPHGSHVCMVFEVLGNNLLKLITKSNYHGIPLENVRLIIKQCLQGLDYLNRKCKIIHTDIKPENILLCVDEKHVKSLADEALDWIKRGIKPVESAVSAMIPKAAVPTKMSKNKKKKLKKKEKLKEQKLLNTIKSDDENSKTESSEIEKKLNSSSMDIDTSLNSKKIDDSCEIVKNKSRHSSSDSQQDVSKVILQKENEIIIPEPVRSPFKDIFTEEELQVKIADLGNACWTNHHFTEDIQTRQYRSLEVIIGAKYDTSADIWSLACMAFELATGDYLFEPHSGDNYTRDEDHIAHIIELLGPIPKNLALSGNFSREYFNKRGELIHIGNLKPWDMYSVLTQKYSWSNRDAHSFSEFLTPMLEYSQSRRATAKECLQHEWIQHPVRSPISRRKKTRSYNSTSSVENSDCNKSTNNSSSSSSEKMHSHSSAERQYIESSGPVDQIHPERHPDRRHNNKFRAENDENVQSEHIDNYEYRKKSSREVGTH